MTTIRWLAGGLWATLVGLSGLDVALTTIGLALGAQEANPLVLPSWMAAVKAAALLTVLGVLGILWRYPRYRSAVVVWLAVASSGMSVVVAWNCWVVYQS